MATKRCSTCNGTGHVMQVPQSQAISRCPDCSGSLWRALTGAARSLTMGGPRPHASRRKARA